MLQLREKDTWLGPSGADTDEVVVVKKKSIII